MQLYVFHIGVDAPRLPSAPIDCCGIGVSLYGIQASTVMSLIRLDTTALS